MNNPWLTPITAVAVISLIASAIAGAPSGRLATSAQADSAAVAAVVDQYHRALSDGDTVTALSLLAANALILESGDVETRDEYRSHHLSADVHFARAVPSARGPVRVAIRGDVAWAISTSKAHGVYRGRTMYKNDRKRRKGLSILVWSAPRPQLTRNRRDFGGATL